MSREILIDQVKIFFPKGPALEQARMHRVYLIVLFFEAESELQQESAFARIVRPFHGTSSRIEFFVDFDCRIPALEKKRKLAVSIFRVDLSYPRDILKFLEMFDSPSSHLVRQGLKFSNRHNFLLSSNLHYTTCICMVHAKGPVDEKINI